MAEDNWGKGGSGGRLVIVTTSLVNNGRISSCGGNGLQGGDGGSIEIYADEISGTGEYDNSGGHALYEMLEKLLVEIDQSTIPNRQEIIADIRENASNEESLLSSFQRWFGVLGDSSSIASLVIAIRTMLA